jgi:ABC-type glycerol-3-phosphate transport system permease component
MQNHKFYQTSQGRIFSQKRLLKLLRTLFSYAVLILIALFCVFPVGWILKTSFESPQYIRNPQIQWTPIQFTLDNYREVLTNPRALIGRSFMNSLIIAGTSTAFAVVITTMAGYAMSRFRFRGKFVFSVYLILINMIPGTLILISMFILLIKLHLVNSYWGLITFYSSVSIPLATWMLKGYFDSIPIELEEQAMIDGATRLEAIRRIIAPLALPGIAAVSMFIFMGNWNEFMAALTILQKQELRTLPVQIINFMGFQRVEWGPVMAYSIIVGLPVALLFIVVQRQLVGGLTAGFTK